MSQASICVLVYFLLTSCGYCQNQSTPGAQTEGINGEYVALEAMPNISPDEPDAKWFHQNTLLVRNDEAILDMDPVYFKRGQEFYSASDGGFLTYRGRFFKKDGQIFIELRLFESDYVGFPVGSDPYKEITTRIAKLDRGRIEIEGIRDERTALIKYRRTVLDKKRRKELLDLLGREPMEKPNL